MSCMSGFSDCGGKLTEARRTVCLCSQGYFMMEWGHLTGHKEKGESREKITWCELKPSLLPLLLYLLTSPLHSIHFRGDMTKPNTYLWHEHCIMLRNCWPLTATVPHSHPVLSEFKHRLQWAVCQVHKHGNELCIYLTTFQLSNLASVLPNLY